MAEGKKRKVHSADFKAKVALEAVRGVMTINEVAQKFEVHPMMVRQWKKEFLDNAGSVFATKRGPKPVERSDTGDTPQEQTGQRCSAAVKEMDLA